MSDKRFLVPIFIWALLAAVVLEGVSGPLMFATLGHAGPEGRFAIFGWLATLINLPGLFLVGILFGHGPVSDSIRIVVAFILQVLLFGLVFWAFLRWAYSRTT